MALTGLSRYLSTSIALLLFCGTLCRPPSGERRLRRVKRLLPDIISSLALTPTFKTKVLNAGSVTATYGVSFPFEVEFDSSAVGNAMSDESKEPPKRTIEKDRMMVLKSVEQALNRAGLNGTECVLRAICEAADEPLRHDGMVGEMLNFILR
ncbi:uncharacterized protein LOC135365711 [Ornithodoros turicata]|uniref:uncharacterized protein LOC135365711 n=1 Tax=Ornithodoros turicata TaxID=34597 RepID=UPI003139F981